MSDKQYFEALRESIVNLDFSKVADIAKKAMDERLDPQMVITEGMVPGMAMVGEKFEVGEYYLSELLVAAEVMREGLKVIHPFLKEARQAKLCNIVIATVEGDRHDLGKNIVITLLEIRGFEVIDLGVDVPTDRIIAAVKKHQPDILGLSALLTVAMDKMEEAIEALRISNLREKVKVVIGGAPITTEFAKKIGADYGTSSAPEGVKKCVEWSQLNRGDKTT